MPQRDLLLPWRNVLDNVALPLELAGQGRAAARHEASKWLEEFGLEGFASCWPRPVSYTHLHHILFRRYRSLKTA